MLAAGAVRVRQAHARMTDSTNKVRRGLRRWWIAIFFVAVLLFCWLGVRWRGAALRRAAIDQIKIDNQALIPAFLPSPAQDRTNDPGEWLMRVARSRPAWDMSDLSDPERYRFLLEEARSNRLGEDARISFEDFEQKFRSLLESAPDKTAFWNEFWVGLAVRLRNCDGTRDWGPAKNSAVHLIAVGLADCMQVARQAAQYGPIDPVRAAAELENSNASFPTLPFLEEARLGDAVHVTAISKAQSGYAAEALESLRAGLAVAHIHAPSEWLMSEMMWSLQMTRVLDALQTILPMLPRGIDLSWLEQELTAARPRDSMARAIRGERAFGNRVLELIRSGDLPRDGVLYAPGTWLSRLHRALVNDVDQARYLTTMTEAARRAESPAYLRTKAIDGVPDSFWAPTAAIIAPEFGPSLRTSDLLEARLGLARAALTAYQKGAKDALTFISESFDPFDGRPLRCGFGDDGLVVFWSTGPDGKDDAADVESDDIVWGLKLAE